MYNNKKVYSLQVSGYSTRTFDKMYKIRDTFESYVDIDDLSPVFYREVKHEDSYHSSISYVYENSGDSTDVYMDFFKRKKSWQDTIKINNFTYDLISTCGLSTQVF